MLDQELNKLRNTNNDPLTRGRICHLHNKLELQGNDKYESSDVFVDTEILMDNYSLYDQNEVERQKSEKRPELKSLLIQFSNYL